MYHSKNFLLDLFIGSKRLRAPNKNPVLWSSRKLLVSGAIVVISNVYNI